MCTLMVAHQVWSSVPLLVAANRDERLDRPSEPPRAWDGVPLPVFAPADARAGGTWLGLNAAGVFCAVTNRFGNTPPEPGRRSRGLLVLDALAHPDALAAAERILAWPGDAHNRFHLIVAAGDGAHLVWSDGLEVEHRALSPGVHVLTERSLGAGPDDRERSLTSWWEQRRTRTPPGLDELKLLLRRHEEDPFDGTCVHAPALGYGTLSSTILRLDAELRLQWFHAEGPPCRTDYRELSGRARVIMS